MKAEMLDCNGTWADYEFNDDEFKFVDFYEDRVKEIQLWKGTNGEWFIFRNIREVEE